MLISSALHAALIDFCKLQYVVNKQLVNWSNSSEPFKHYNCFLNFMCFATPLEYIADRFF